MTSPNESDQALVRAQNALADNPDDVGLMVDLAVCLLADGQFGRGMQIATRAATLAPDHFRAQRALSGAQMALGDLEAAANSAVRAVSIERSNTEARLHLAGILVTMRQFNDAIPHLMAVVHSRSASAHAWRLLSAALTELGRRDRAIDAIDQAIAIAPGELEYSLHRTSLLIARRRFDEALQQVNQVLHQVPDDAAALRIRSGLLETLNQSEAALADAERAAALKPEDTALQRHLMHLRARAGLADTATVPDDAELAAQAERWIATRPSPSRPPRAATVSFYDALRLQIRIILAILLRDMRTRHGRSRLGYFWAIAEPIGHLATLGSVFAYLSPGRPPLGTDHYVFYVTGLLPYLMFSHTVSELIPALSSNGAVLSLPVVRQIDVIAAKSAMVLATDMLVAFLVMTAFTFLGRPGVPADLLPCMMALVTAWFLGVGFGVINMIIAEFYPTWETFIHALLRMMYFASGIYYSPLTMPSWLRNILTLNPVLQCVEWFRSGHFTQYTPHWLDIDYTFAWVAGLALVGLALLRTMRRRLVVLG